MRRPDGRGNGRFRVTPTAGRTLDPVTTSPPGARGSPNGSVRIRRLASAELGAAEIAEIRQLLSAAFGDDPEERFEDADWEHALGGVHIVVDDRRRDRGPRRGRRARAPRRRATDPDGLRGGRRDGARSTRRRASGRARWRSSGRSSRPTTSSARSAPGSHHFYERLGWETWRGPAFVRTPDGDRRTPEDEGYILVLRTGPDAGPRPVGRRSAASGARATSGSRSRTGRHGRGRTGPGGGQVARRASSNGTGSANGSRPRPRLAGRHRRRELARAARSIRSTRLPSAATPAAPQSSAAA